MKLQANKFAAATAITFSILWIICSAFVALVPNPSMALTGTMVHADLSAMSWSLTWISFVVGLVGWAILGAITAWSITFIYAILDCMTSDSH